MRRSFWRLQDVTERAILAVVAVLGAALAALGVRGTAGLTIVAIGVVLLGYLLVSLKRIVLGPPEQRRGAWTFAALVLGTTVVLPVAVLVPIMVVTYYAQVVPSKLAARVSGAIRVGQSPADVVADALAITPRGKLAVYADICWPGESERSYLAYYYSRDDRFVFVVSGPHLDAHGLQSGSLALRDLAQVRKTLPTLPLCGKVAFTFHQIFYHVTFDVPIRPDGTVGVPGPPRGWD